MKTPNRNWLTWKKIACISLLLLAAGYIYGRPHLERWLNIELWEIPIGQDDGNNIGDNDGVTGGNQQGSLTVSDKQFSVDGDGDKRQAENKNTSPEFKLKDIGGGQKQSPAGLVYGMGPGGETRIDHILRHTRDMPNRPTHSVFDGGRDEVLALLDESYKLIQKKSNKVNGRKSNQGGSNRMEYVIRMDRRVGYSGGQKGKRNNHKALNQIKLILEGNQPVTAYPY